jgi:serine/threonine-protein kinase
LNNENPKNLLGTTLDGRYIIESIISQSTSGSKAGLQSTTTVYRAHDTAYKCPVVIKHFVPQNPYQNLALERFILEARALLVIKHRAIVEIRDVVLQNEGSAFIVMERLEGLTLRKHLAKNGALSFHAFVAICSQILEALELTHRKGIIHRDLKPDNIIVMQAPAIERIKLIDFGIAQLPGNGGHLQLTKTGDMLGTPLYMSPEQCLGEALDERSDIYSLGCIMYEMLTGQAPFNGDSILAVMTKKVTEQPATIAPSEKINQQQIVQFERIINKAMAKAPQERYQSAQELHADLLRSSTLSRNKVNKSSISIVFNKFFGSSED